MRLSKNWQNADSIFSQWWCSTFSKSSGSCDRTFKDVWILLWSNRYCFWQVWQDLQNSRNKCREITDMEKSCTFNASSAWKALVILQKQSAKSLNYALDWEPSRESNNQCEQSAVIIHFQCSICSISSRRLKTPSEACNHWHRQHNRRRNCQINAKENQSGYLNQLIAGVAIK